MSFFGKLKSKLFKSSAKLEEGLDAIVQEDIAPEEAPAGPALADEAGQVAQPEALPVPDPVGDSPLAPEHEQGVSPQKAAEPIASAPKLAIDPLEVDSRPLNPLPQKTGVFGRTPRRVLDDDMLEQLEELLISSDMGVDTAVQITANLAEGRFGKKLSTAEIKSALAEEIARVMDPVARPLPIYNKKPQVILVVGVNGSGKTTTIGKLASQFQRAGKSVVIAAGDTFRAAAVGQLQVWGERAGVPVMTAAEGSDPASLAFEAMGQAEQDGADLLMIDTAGRLHNRADLMEELSKIIRVIRKKDPDAPHNTVLVLDATTGQNAVNQVEVFQRMADVTGLVMTKLDGTAKGGVLVSLADKFALPIHAIGVGEQIDDLDAFDPQEFAAALTGVSA
jgi:fused signal recognition particle receptor